MKYEQLTHKIIGCAMEVHSVLGNGFQEVIYQRALAHEMGLQQLGFEREFEMPVIYKELRIGTRRVDFLVEEFISVEIKALIKLEDVHLAQAMNYLEAYKSPSQNHNILFGCAKRPRLAPCRKGFQAWTLETAS